MIKAFVVVSNDNVSFGEKGTFYKGKEYLARYVKNGSDFVVCSNEGLWIPMCRPVLSLNQLSRNLKFFQHFGILKEFHVRNFMEMNVLTQELHKKRANK